MRARVVTSTSRAIDGSPPTPWLVACSSENVDTADTPGGNSWKVRVPSWSDRPTLRLTSRVRAAASLAKGSAAGSTFTPCQPRS